MILIFQLADKSLIRLNGINVNKGIIIVRTGTHVPTPLIKDNPVLLDTINTFAGFIRADGSYSVYLQSPDFYYLQAFTNNFLPGYYNDEGTAFGLLAEC